jgi:hypothetical protein
VKRATSFFWKLYLAYAPEDSFEGTVCYLDQNLENYVKIGSCKTSKEFKEKLDIKIKNLLENFNKVPEYVQIDIKRPRYLNQKPISLTDIPGIEDGDCASLIYRYLEKNYYRTLPIFIVSMT